MQLGQVEALLYYLGFSLLVASVTRFCQTFSRSNITGKIFLDFRFLSEILKWIPMVPLVCSMKYFLTDMFSLKMISRGLRKMNIICVTCKMPTGGTFPANPAHVLLCMRAVRRLWTPESSSICFISSLSVCANTSNETGSSRSYKKYWLTALRNCSSLEIIVFFFTWLDGQGWGHGVLPWLLRQLLNEPRPEHFKRRCFNRNVVYFHFHVI